MCVCARCFFVCAALDYKMPVVLLYKAKKSGHLKRCAVYGKRRYNIVVAILLSVCVCARVCACSGGLMLARLCKEGKREEGRSDLHFKSPVQTSSVCLPLLQATFMILSLTLKVKTGFFFSLKQLPSLSLSLFLSPPSLSLCILG